MPEMHPIGTFDNTKIIDHGFDESSKKGTLFLWIKFQTEAGTITGRFYMTDGAVEHTLEKIANAGFTGDSLLELKDGQVLVGNLCQITVDHEDVDGRVVPKVGWVNENFATAGPSHNEKAAANVKQFDALWRKTMKDRAAQEDVPF